MTDQSEKAVNERAREFNEHRRVCWRCSLVAVLLRDAPGRSSWLLCRVGRGLWDTVLKAVWESVAPAGMYCPICKDKGPVLGMDPPPPEGARILFAFSCGGCRRRWEWWISNQAGKASYALKGRAAHEEESGP